MTRQFHNFFNLITFLQFVFEGVIGKSYKGDIGLDDISVNDGQCPPTGRIYAEITDHKMCPDMNEKVFDWDVKHQHKQTTKNKIEPYEVEPYEVIKLL